MEKNASIVDLKTDLRKALRSIGGKSSSADKEKCFDFRTRLNIFWKWPARLFAWRLYDWQIDQLTGFADL
ncbi:MAG: hypothetical protein MZV70_10215 [Desulfobacterales bacterium]|nr:hypothetical protein [Desulfobacterales bacterium]